MIRIKYSPELLRDFNALKNDFQNLMTMNLVQADKGLDPPCQRLMRELITNSVQNAKALQNLFTEPLMKHESTNRAILISKGGPIIQNMLN